MSIYFSYPRDLQPPADHSPPWQARLSNAMVPPRQHFCSLLFRAVFWHYSSKTVTKGLEQVCEEQTPYGDKQK
jgi:hypothetical protein